MNDLFTQVSRGDQFTVRELFESLLTEPPIENADQLELDFFVSEVEYKVSPQFKEAQYS